MARKSVHMYLAVLLAAVIAGGEKEDETNQEVEGVVSVVARRVAGVGGGGMGVVVRQIVGEHLAGCQVVVVTTSPAATDLTKNVFVSGNGGECVDGGGGCGTETSEVAVKLESLFSQSKKSRTHLLQALWKDPRVVCRAVVLDLTNHTLATRFLEESGLWRRPETYVILVGRNEGEQDVLLHPSLRNTIHALCVLPNIRALHARPRTHALHLEEGGREGASDGWWLRKVRVLSRCLFCSEGRGPTVLPLPYPGLQAPPQTHTLLFPQRGTDLMGRRLRVAMLPYFPLSDNEKSLREEGSVLLTPRDSLDVRIINTMAAHLNFTYELVEPPDGQWGVVDDHGNWTGVVGMIQQERADLSFCLTITAPRLPVMDYTRIYTNDPLVIISLKPKSLPQYLSTVRPLTGELWEILALSIVGWGFATWLLQKAWSWVSGRPGVELNYALLYSWGTMLANPPTNQTINVVERILLGWWLVFCLVITTAYRSSLVAHLTVQGKSAPINSFQDLLDRDQWAWGSLKSFRMSAYVQIFQKTPDPTLKKMYEKVEIREAGEGLALVLRGHYSFITGKYYIQSIIAMNYTDYRGYSPLYISKREYTLWAGFIWAFRKGAPFGRSLSLVKQRLLEAGLVDYWTNDVMETRIRNDKRRRGTQTAVVFVKEKVGGERQVVLGLSHLLSVFLLLLLGYCLAFLVLLAENLAHRFRW